MQKLGAVTLVTGIILLFILRHEETPPPHDLPTPARSNKAVDPGVRVVPEKAAALKGANRPPVVTAIKLSPNVVFPGTPVFIEVKTTDPDQDDIVLNCVWCINGQVSEQSGTEFDTTGLHKGDLLTVTVTADDGKESGQPLASNGILIQNRSPEITSMPSAGISNGHFSYQVIATDPDNDPLQFSLEEAPPGMTIDAAGLIQWDVPQGLQGKQQVRVTVSDGSGSSFQAFDLDFATAPAKR